MELKKLKKIIADVIPSVTEDEITLESKFIDDLGADSLDIYSIYLAIEEEFEIEIPDGEADKIVTVGDAVEEIKKAINA